MSGVRRVSPFRGAIGRFGRRNVGMRFNEVGAGASAEVYFFPISCRPVHVLPKPLHARLFNHAGALLRNNAPS